MMDSPACVPLHDLTDDNEGRDEYENRMDDMDEMSTRQYNGSTCTVSDVPQHTPNPTESGAEVTSRVTSDQSTCVVCSDVANGRYFGATVCLPCKSFYIRCTKAGQPVFSRRCTGDCDVTKQSRIRCQSCRYQRCLSAGMARREKPLYIHPEEGQCLCSVCGDLANGIHFGVYTCEGCKKFYRRALAEGVSYHCKKFNQCAINPRSRNSCRACRYRKCTSVGMSRHAIKMGRPKKRTSYRGRMSSTSEYQRQEEVSGDLHYCSDTFMESVSGQDAFVGDQEHGPSSILSSQRQTVYKHTIDPSLAAGRSTDENEPMASDHETRELLLKQGHSWTSNGSIRQWAPEHNDMQWKRRPEADLHSLGNQIMHWTSEGAANNNTCQNQVKPLITARPGKTLTPDYDPEVWVMHQNTHWTSTDESRKLTQTNQDDQLTPTHHTGDRTSRMQDNLKKVGGTVIKRNPRWTFPCTELNSAYCQSDPEFTVKSASTDDWGKDADKTFDGDMETVSFTDPVVTADEAMSSYALSQDEISSMLQFLVDFENTERVSDKRVEPEKTASIDRRHRVVSDNDAVPSHTSEENLTIRHDSEAKDHPETPASNSGSFCDPHEKFIETDNNKRNEKTILPLTVSQEKLKQSTTAVCKQHEESSDTSLDSDPKGQYHNMLVSSKYEDPLHFCGKENRLNSSPVRHTEIRDAVHCSSTLTQPDKDHVCGNCNLCHTQPHELCPDYGNTYGCAPRMSRQRIDSSSLCESSKSYEILFNRYFGNNNSRGSHTVQQNSCEAGTKLSNMFAEGGLCRDGCGYDGLHSSWLESCYLQLDKRNDLDNVNCYIRDPEFLLSSLQRMTDAFKILAMFTKQQLAQKPFPNTTHKSSASSQDKRASKPMPKSRKREFDISSLARKMWPM